MSFTTYIVRKAIITAAYSSNSNESKLFNIRAKIDSPVVIMTIRPNLSVYSKSMCALGTDSAQTRKLLRDINKAIENPRRRRIVQEISLRKPPIMARTPVHVKVTIRNLQYSSASSIW